MATRIAVEVDVKTRDAAAEIDDLKEQMEKLKATTDDLRRRWKADSNLLKKEQKVHPRECKNSVGLS